MRKSQKALKILFADDHQIVREGFIRLIDREEGLEIVAEAEALEKQVLEAVNGHIDL